MKEAEIVRQCLEYLSRCGVMAWRNNSGAAKIGERFVRFGKTGSADILGILPGGRALCVECKTPKGKLSPSQDAWLLAAKESGAMVVIARGVDDLIEAMEGG